MATDQEEREREVLASPFSYFALLHRLLDTGLTHLSGPQQILYLQLLRESFGRGSCETSLTLLQLNKKTGISKSTLIKALARLRHLGHLEILDAGGPRTPAQFRVLIKENGKRPNQGSIRIDSHLEQLDQEDQNLLRSLEQGLSPSERKEFHDRVEGDFKDLRLKVDPYTEKQALLFLLLRERMYHRIHSKYPHLFQ